MVTVLLLFLVRLLPVLTPFCWGAWELEPHVLCTACWKGLDHHACQVSLPPAPTSFKKYLAGAFPRLDGRLCPAARVLAALLPCCLTTVLSKYYQVSQRSSHCRWKRSTFIASRLYVGTGVSSGPHCME